MYLYLFATASAKLSTGPLSSVIIWSLLFITFSSWAMHLDNSSTLGGKSVYCPSVCRSIISFWLGKWSTWSPGHPNASALTSSSKKASRFWLQTQLYLLVQNASAWSFVSLMTLLVGDAEFTLGHLAYPRNSPLEGDILLKMCLQHMSTHLMIQLTGIITGLHGYHRGSHSTQKHNQGWPLCKSPHSGQVWQRFLPIS